MSVAILIGMGAVVAIEPTDVNIEAMTFGSTKLDPFTTLVAAVFVVIVTTIYYFTYRAFMRKKRGLTPLVYYYARNKNVDTFSMLSALTLIVTIMWTLLFYWASDNGSIAICGLFVPVIFICFSNAFLYYMKNDYRMFKDISMLN